MANESNVVGHIAGMCERVQVGACIDCDALLAGGLLRCRRCAAAPPVKAKECATRPPLGVKPKWLVREQRIAELADALARYAADAEHMKKRASTMRGWVEELNELLFDAEMDDEARA